MQVPILEQTEKGKSIMTKDEQMLIAHAVKIATFNGLIEDGNVSEEISTVVADYVESEFIERSQFLVLSSGGQIK